MLEDEHEQAIGGTDREQVERDCGERDGDRSESDRQQDEGESEDEGEYERRRLRGVLEVASVVDPVRAKARAAIEPASTKPHTACVRPA